MKKIIIALIMLMLSFITNISYALTDCSKEKKDFDYKKNIYTQIKKEYDDIEIQVRNEF